MELDRVGQDRRAGKRGAVISPLPPVIPAWGDSFLLPPQSTPTFLIPPLLWVLWMALEGQGCSLSHLEDRVVSGVRWPFAFVMKVPMEIWTPSALGDLVPGIVYLGAPGGYVWGAWRTSLYEFAILGRASLHHSRACFCIAFQVKMVPLVMMGKFT